MPSIKILETGHIDRGDSAFATLVRLDKGDIVCGFSRGGQVLRPIHRWRPDMVLKGDEAKHACQTKDWPR